MVTYPSESHVARSPVNTQPFLNRAASSVALFTYAYPDFTRPCLLLGGEQREVGRCADEET
jgi:hypothetical protein